jgi:(hydroxyamino)benzene mutase
MMERLLRTTKQQLDANVTERIAKWRGSMNESQLLARQGQRLLQCGVALFLFTSFEGFAVPYFAVPNLGRSVHTLSAFTGVLFVALGLTWPRLHLGMTASRIAFWFLIYSALTTIAAFVLAAILGAGSSIMPLAAVGARGSDFQEALIQFAIYPAAPAGIASFALILWGLRHPAMPPAAETTDTRPAAAHARREIMT